MRSPSGSDRLIASTASATIARSRAVDGPITHRHLKLPPQGGGPSLLHTLNLRRDAGVASSSGHEAERLERPQSLREQAKTVFVRGISVLSDGRRKRRNVNHGGYFGGAAGGDSGASPGNRIGIPQEIP